MSRQFRYRVAALVLGGLLLGGPLVASGTASAEQVSPEQAQADEGGHQVTFAGSGMFGLSCHSRPDIESMTVPADSTIRVVNQTGHSANLQLGGDTKGMLPDNESTEVIFRRGTTAVTLTPTCALGNDATPVLVTAQPSMAATTPDPIPNPTVGDSSAFAADPTGSSNPPDSTLPDTLSAPVRPDRLASTAGRPSSTRAKALHSATVAQASTAGVQGMPPGGTGANGKIKSGPGTRGGAAPAFSGMPLGTKKALASGVPDLALDPSTSGAGAPDLSTSGAGTAAMSAPTTEIAAAEPVAAMEPMREQGPTGLLAAIAAVCALGVGIAAIRAFVSQRANQARMA
jgi:hypothetical protein